MVLGEMFTSATENIWHQLWDATSRCHNRTIVLLSREFASLPMFFVCCKMMTPNELLPTEQDFDPWNGNLDAQSAWKHFGGLTLQEADSKFRENPLYYQEDFMFMGGRAFAFYFPVLEAYLKDIADTNNASDSESWILAKGIQSQFDGETLADVRQLAPRVIELARFVLDNIDQIGVDSDEQQRVSAAWTELARHIEKTVK